MSEFAGGPVLSSGPAEAKIARLYAIAQAAFDRAVVELDGQFDEAARTRHRLAHSTLAEMLGRPPEDWHFSALPDPWRRSRDVAVLHWIRAGGLSVIQSITFDERGLIARAIVSQFDSPSMRWVIPSSDDLAIARVAFGMSDAHERIDGTAAMYSKAVV